MSENTDNLLIGTMLLLSAFLIGAIQNAVVKLIGHNAPTMMVLASQYFVSFICVFPILAKSKFQLLKTQRIGAILWRSIMGGVYFGGMFFAVKYISLMDVSLLSSTGPIWIPIIMLVFLRQMVAKIIILGAVIGFIGVALILHPNGSVFSLGGLIALIAGIGAALSMMAVASLTKTEKAMTVLSYYFLFTFILPIPFVIYAWKTPSLGVALLMLANGVLMFVHQMFLFKGFSYGPASRLGSTIYSGVIFSALIGWIFWGEVPFWYSLAGAVLVIIGGTIAITTGKK